MKSYNNKTKNIFLKGNLNLILPFSSPQNKGEKSPPRRKRVKSLNTNFSNEEFQRKSKSEQTTDFSRKPQKNQKINIFQKFETKSHTTNSSTYSPLSIISELSMVEKSGGEASQEIFPNIPFFEKSGINFKNTVYQILNSMSPCSSSSLEVALCLTRSLKMATVALERFGPHEYGVDLFEAFINYSLKKGRLTKREIFCIFSSGKSGFYDYCYFRNIEKLIQEEFGNRS